jgi:hypothetical protein
MLGDGVVKSIEEGIPVGAADFPYAPVAKEPIVGALAPNILATPRAEFTNPTPGIKPAAALIAVAPGFATALLKAFEMGLEFDFPRETDVEGVAGELEGKVDVDDIAVSAEGDELDVLSPVEDPPPVLSPPISPGAPPWGEETGVAVSLIVVSGTAGAAAGAAIPEGCNFCTRKGSITGNGLALCAAISFSSCWNMGGSCEGVPPSA